MARVVGVARVARVAGSLRGCAGCLACWLAGKLDELAGWGTGLVERLVWLGWWPSQPYGALGVSPAVMGK